MSAKDNNSSLLSKVAKFVRNPTTNWTDLDKQDPEPEAGYSKQALKEMIERKRQNDFVRKREFDQLRKLRSRDPGAAADLAGRPSYFQSSLPSNPDERAMTIKKIDEIEAQMSNQWWQGKNEGAPKPGAAPAPPAKPARTEVTPDVESDPAYAPTRLSPMRPAAEAETSDFPPTQDHSGFGPSTGPSTGPHDLAPASRNGASVSPSLSPASGMGHGFTHSRPPPVEWVEGMSDPDLEEAAIRFANADEVGAEAGLKAVLDDPSATPERALRWTMALLDLYRATGQQAPFDALSITCAQRFGRSAPPWFSIPAQLGVAASRAMARTVPSRLVAEVLWRSPAAFDAGAVDELRLAIANAPAPWFIDWEPLVRIDPAATEPLNALFAEWCSTPVELHFSGTKALESALRRCTQSGDRNASQVHWRMRLDALRLMGMRDEFELVALDFCVTYEVSPPAWQDVRCKFEVVSASGARVGADDPQATDPGGLAPITSGAPLRQAPTVLMGLESTASAVCELSGEVQGDAAEAIARMESDRAGALRLAVSCAHLVRVDFSAAGSILNWVAGLQNDGCQVQFVDLHHLVAAFFGVVGIHEHARVVLRSD